MSLANDELANLHERVMVLDSAARGLADVIARLSYKLDAAQAVVDAARALASCKCMISSGCPEAKLRGAVERFDETLRGLAR